LELFVHEKHLWRLNQEKSNLNRRVEQIDNEMITIEATIDRLKDNLDKERQHRRVVLQEEKPLVAAPLMKTMTIEY
jgi:predicted RNase H-like nuclease (RuvC/YqgF family)